MSSLISAERPPAFCPGCSHEQITKTLDRAFNNLGLSGEKIVIVSDIGCSGLFDTFFKTHAFHGLHGRALTYAAGLKLAQPDLIVIVTMGDGGQGIGGAHLLAACRRNLDLTLLILNNFNFGMTGGQFSATTPMAAKVGSGLLNQLEQPMDICSIAKSAGAPYVSRSSTYQKNLEQEFQNAIQFNGFSVLDIWGICPGRYTKQNRLTPKTIDEMISSLPPETGVVPQNVRKEYGKYYRELLMGQKPVDAPAIKVSKSPQKQVERQEIIILGSAGQRIITAGEILCLAGMSAGLHVTQKNEYNITVLRGPSISEVILSSEEIDYTGIDNPAVIIAIGQEGVDHRKAIFETLNSSTIILQAEDIQLPETLASIHSINFKSLGIKPVDRALASLFIILLTLQEHITLDNLKTALKSRFKGKSIDMSFEISELPELNT